MSKYKQESNVGETGVKSIRLNGARIDALPMHMSAVAKQQMPAKWDEELKNKIEDILGRYPQHTVAWLESQIRECQSNIKRMKEEIGRQRATIEEYRGHITITERRDDMLALVDPNDKEALRKFNRDNPPYSIPKMREQIGHCEEAIGRCEEVIDKEHESISEFNGWLALCKLRDQELAAYGYKVT